MKSIGRLLTAVALSLAISSGAQAALRPVSELSTSLIPDGYEAGRTDVKYGTYSTVVGEGARPYQDRLLLLGKKAYGLSTLVDDDPVYQSELTYLLENEAIRLFSDVSVAPTTAVTEFEREALLYGTVKTYADIRHHSERLYENMIRFIDVKLPGPNGQQIRSEIAEGTARAALYEPNYRSDKDLTPEQRAAAYQEKLKSFLAKGGSLSEITTLNADSYAKLPRFSRFEYVWLENGEVKITPGSAGHLLLASGAPVQSAGQLVFVKGPTPETSMMIVTNASGSYKPDLLSAQNLSTELLDMTGISPTNAIVTKGEPLSTQAVRIYLKGEGTKPEMVSTIAKELEAKASITLGPALLGTPQVAAAKPRASAQREPTLWLGCAAVFAN